VKPLAQAPRLATFLDTTPVAVLTTVVDTEGTLHPAALHYWHDPETLSFYFVTEKSSEKCRLLLDGAAQRAACVVGTEEGVAFTLQMSGEVRMVPKSEYQFAILAYARKRGDSHHAEADNFALLQFHPTVARYTDYTGKWMQYYINLEK
jgi:uncharacterized protein YhbP (UPF0306 family)